MVDADLEEFEEAPQAQDDFIEDDDEFAGFIDDDTGEPGQRQRRGRRSSGLPAGANADAMRVGAAQQHVWSTCVELLPTHGYRVQIACMHTCAHMHAASLAERVLSACLT